MFTVLLVALFLSVLTSVPTTVLAVTWTPLIAAEDFTGIRTDVLTTSAGILSVVLIILGVGILIRTLR